jgi:hypothetical protein
MMPFCVCHQPAAAEHGRAATFAHGAKDTVASDSASFQAVTDGHMHSSCVNSLLLSMCWMLQVNSVIIAS